MRTLWDWLNNPIPGLEPVAPVKQVQPDYNTYRHYPNMYTTTPGITMDIQYFNRNTPSYVNIPVENPPQT